jgi:hypothetical protein
MQKKGFSSIVYEWKQSQFLRDCQNSKPELDGSMAMKKGD